MHQKFKIKIIDIHLLIMSDFLNKQNGQQV